MMRWARFAVALLVTLVIQTTVLRFVAGPWLDLLLVLALVCALAAPRDDARLAALLVGLAQDMQTEGPLGVFALGLGLSGLVVTGLREQVNRHLWWVRWLIACVAAVPGQLLIALHKRFWQGDNTSWGQLLLNCLITSVVAALLAAVVVGFPAAYRRRRHRYSAMRW